MNDSVKKNKVVPLLFSICIICQISTLAMGWIPILTRYWLVLGLSSMISLAIAPSFARRKDFLFLLLYTIIVTLNVVAGDVYFYNTSAAIVEFSILLFPSVVFYYVCTCEDKQTAKILLIVVFALIAMTSFCSYRLAAISPSIIRDVFLSRGESGISMGFYRKGLSNYLLPHAIPVVIPALVMLVRNRSVNVIKRILFVGLLLLLLSLVFSSGATTPLLMSVISLLLSFMISEKQNAGLQNSLKIIICVCVCVFLVNDALLLKMLDFLDSLIDNKGAFHSKIIIFEDLIKYGEATGDLESRIEKYSETTTSILSNFLIGTNGECGGHSALFTRFATLGIFGGILYIYYLFSMIKYAYVRIITIYKPYYVIGVSMALIMLTLKNMACIEMFLMLFAVLPMSLYLAGADQNKFEVNEQE